MHSKPPIFWIALFLLLFVVQVWLVPAVIRAVTGTELLRGTQEQGGDAHPVFNDATFAAYRHCNRYLQLSNPQANFVFPEAPERGWDLGFNRYMISGLATASDARSGQSTRHYVCRITIQGSELSEYSDWKVDAIELLAP